MIRRTAVILVLIAVAAAVGALQERDIFPVSDRKFYRPISDPYIGYPISPAGAGSIMYWNGAAWVGSDANELKWDPNTVVVTDVNVTGVLTLQNLTDEHGQNEAESLAQFLDHEGNLLASVSGMHDGTSDDSYGRLVFKVSTIYGDIEAMSFNKGARFMVGRVYNNGGTDGQFTTVNVAADNQLYFECFSDTTVQGNLLQFRKSHNDTAGIMTATINGENLGVIDFKGTNSIGNFDQGARIIVTQAGAAHASAVPATLDFHTDTGSGLATRLLIDDSGDIIIPGDVNASNFYVTDDGRSGNLDNYWQYHDDVNYITSPSGTKVGIGTTTPGARTESRAADCGAPVTSGNVQTYGSLRLRGDETNVIDFGCYANPILAGWIQVSEAANLAINYNLALQPNGGNVGIGTAEPNENLEISADLSDGEYGGLRISNSAWTATGRPMIDFFNSHPSANFSVARIFSEIGSNGTNSKLYFAVDDGSKGTLENRMVIDKDGNVGIGTDSPERLLDVAFTAPVIRISDTDANSVTKTTGFLEFGFTTGGWDRSGWIGYGSSTNDVLTINNEDGSNIALIGANVGIGLSDPSAKLEVAGSIVIADGATIGSVATPGAITVEGDGDIVMSQDLTVDGSIITTDITLTAFASGAETIAHILEDIVNPLILHAFDPNDQGGLDIAWGAGKIYTATGAVVDVDGNTGTCTDNIANHLFWASGSELTLSTTEPNSMEIPVAHILCQAGDIWELDVEPVANTLTRDIQHGLSELFPVAVAEGCITAAYTDDATSDLDVETTGGQYYHDAHTEHVVGAINTEDTSLRGWYHVDSNWTSEQTVDVNTSDYDDLTDKAEIGTNKWVRGLFLISTTEIHYIYPQTFYAVQAQALVGLDPIVPPGLMLFPKSTAIIFQKNESDLTNATFIDVRPLLGTTASGAAVSDHGSLSGLTDTSDHVYALLIDGTRALAGPWSMGNQATTNVNIDSGIITGITDLAIADGGTGAGNAGDARTNLGLVIGTNIQAWDAGLDNLAALSYVSDSFVKVTATDTYAVRTLSETKQDLSLDNVSNVATDDTAYNAASWNANTDAATKNAIRDKVETQDTAIGLNTSHRGETSGNPHAVTPTELSLVIGTDTQAFGEVLDDFNTLGSAASDGQFIVATGAGAFAYEATTAARTSLGVGEAQSPLFANIKVADGGNIGSATTPGAVTIDSAGQTGIGPAGVTPATLLHLARDGDAYLTLQNLTDENRDGGAETRILFQDHTGTTLAQIQGSHNASADDTRGELILSTHTGVALVARVKITAAGSTLIGDPASVNVTQIGPTGHLSFVGAASIEGLKLNYIPRTSIYPVQPTDDVIICGAGNQTFDVRLPVPVARKIYTIKNIGSGTITVDAAFDGSTNIDGAATVDLAQNEFITVFSDGVEYWIIGTNK